MKIITEGHNYVLDSFENTNPQSIQFIEKVNAKKYSDLGLTFPYPSPTIGYSDTELFTVHDGTTNEDVLKVLIDRMEYLNSKFYSIENVLTIIHLEAALRMLENRTKNRKERNIEGKAIV